MTQVTQKLGLHWPQHNEMDSINRLKRYSCRATGNRGQKMGRPPPGYKTKFANFIKLCRKTEARDVVIVATPHALGDTYDELIESLNHLADAKVHLAIVPPRREPEPSDSGQEQVGAGCRRRNRVPAACTEFGRFGPKRVFPDASNV